ncbi:MAG: hypothetical protein LQ340_006029 [Diploschistes diacapsis]|nr:MAG: hypothetical protein LQ340_006029 [Diploschistes diacapsis]
METEERPSKVRKLNDGNVTEKQTPEKSQGIDLDMPSQQSDQEHQASDGRDRPRAEDDQLNSEKIATTEPAVKSSQVSEKPAAKPMSKNQLKKLRRHEQWEAGREEWKAKRKLKDKERKERKRAERDRHAAEQARENSEFSATPKPADEAKLNPAKSVLLPVTFLVDCGFDELMMDKEIHSLTSQITRCYSTNRHAPCQAHMMLCSFNGRLKERMEIALSNHHRSWSRFRCVDDDFVVAAEKAKEHMSGRNGGKLAGSFSARAEESGCPEGEGEVVYLTSDSPNTLEELKPYSTYIIGGLVDKNRHKGICYKRARDKGVKTTKLPISRYMEMNSRFILTTNHVYEIMLKWLETKDWGEAFMAVMPKRKGASLKSKENEAEAVLEQPRREKRGREGGEGSSQR